jgi:hypothetical protein
MSAFLSRFLPYSVSLGTGYGGHEGLNCPFSRSVVALGNFRRPFARADRKKHVLGRASVSSLHARKALGVAPGASCGFGGYGTAFEQIVNQRPFKGPPRGLKRLDMPSPLGCYYMPTLVGMY